MSDVVWSIPAVEADSKGMTFLTVNKICCQVLPLTNTAWLFERKGSGGSWGNAGLTLLRLAAQEQS